ncbi:MAG: bifunctional UDP-sugar hydrolase/5'-nucleotidase [Candidatus Gastranaerophilales bacterium]|nr:bifunctional UDP-sugar hydrolase/5'-nucleotidase [Candidatus Gastranaerophilales bacterium]
MVAPITQVQPNPITTGSQQPKRKRTSIFYINDLHSNLTNLEKLKNASDRFDASVKSSSTDVLKLSAGDIGVGRDTSFNRLAVDFQNSIGIMASAGGNHEFDLNKKDLVEVLKGAKYKFLGLNVEIPEDNQINKELHDDIVKSYIQEENGDKYGVIGLLPFDFAMHLSDPEEYGDFNIMPPEKTVPLLQAEVDRMKAQGVNKIILLSHVGYQDDFKLAQAVEGLDIIIGGHNHDLIIGVQEGKNLFYSKKTGEPTVIVQAGRNGDYFGVLNLEFDENGVIKDVQNNVSPTVDFSRSLVMKQITDSILGKPEVIGTIKSSPKHRHTLVDENPGVNFIADAEKSELGVDIVLINAGNIRSSIEAGPLTNRDLQILTPFDNKLWIIKLTEPELVEALKVSAGSLANVDGVPGILQFSGLKYTMSKKGEVKAAVFVNKDGKEIPIDVNNPNPFKTYSVAVDDFIGKGGNGYIPNKDDTAITKFNFDKNKLVADYLKKHPEPVEISTEKRITFVD